MTENNIHISPLIHVEEFHLTYKQTIRVTPNADIPERKLRIILIREELIKELHDAIIDNDIIETVDALADTLYVTYGAALAHGIDIDHKLNVPNHTTPALKIKELIVSQGTPLPSVPTFRKEVLLKAYTRLSELFDRYVIASETLNINELAQAIKDIIMVTYETSIKIGVDIDDVLLEVQRSNRTKLGADGQPVYNNENKVIKGPFFVEPRILEILTKQGYKN